MRILDVLILDALAKSNVRVKHVHGTITRQQVEKANALIEQGAKVTDSISKKLKVEEPETEEENKGQGEPDKK